VIIEHPRSSQFWAGCKLIVDIRQQLAYIAL
jgi:hypothetical protein